MVEWEGIERKSFKRARNMTTVHMKQFITKFMSTTLTTMKIMKQQGHTTTNLWHRYGLAPQKIQHLYQCTYKGSRGIWTATLVALRKWLKAWNTDPDITICFYPQIFIYCRKRKWPDTVSKSNSTLRHILYWLAVYSFRSHSYIPLTYTTNLFHSHHKEKRD